MIHLDELIQIDTVQVKDTAQVVPENKVIPKFYNSLDLLRVIIPE